MSQDVEAECPACGCNDVPVIDTGTRWGQAINRRRCGHCGVTFNQTLPRNKKLDVRPKRRKRIEKQNEEEAKP